MKVVKYIFLVIVVLTLCYWVFDGIQYYHIRRAIRREFPVAARPRIATSWNTFIGVKRDTSSRYLILFEFYPVDCPAGRDSSYRYFYEAFDHWNDLRFESDIISAFTSVSNAGYRLAKDRRSREGFHDTISFDNGCAMGVISYGTWSPEKISLFDR